ncbi:MAG: hypothetical protein HQL01_11840 [Nitrospirae bacterium]|nr:hypothetical protein [Nitrospirota bacterium]
MPITKPSKKRAVKRTPADNGGSIFDDAEALIELAKKSFAKAAKREAAKHEALGIPTHYAINGKLAVYTPPPPKRKPNTPQ